MKFWFLFFVISVGYISSLPTPAAESTDAEKFCVYKNVTVRGGTSSPAPIGDCHDILCTDAKHNSYLLQGCTFWNPPPENCVYAEHEDLTVSWPDCCPKLVCHK